MHWFAVSDVSFLIVMFTKNPLSEELLRPYCHRIYYYLQYVYCMIAFCMYLGLCSVVSSSLIGR